MQMLDDFLLFECPRIGNSEPCEWTSMKGGDMSFSQYLWAVTVWVGISLLDPMSVFLAIQ